MWRTDGTAAAARRHHRWAMQRLGAVSATEVPQPLQKGLRTNTWGWWSLLQRDLAGEGPRAVRERDRAGRADAAGRHMRGFLERLHAALT